MKCRLDENGLAPVKVKVMFVAHMAYGRRAQNLDSVIDSDGKVSILDSTTDAVLHAVVSFDCYCVGRDRI